MKNLAAARCTPGPDTAAGTTDAPGGELRPLTGLRIVAAAWVVAFHFHFTGLPGVADVSALLGPLVTQGALGVDLFFVLSGFVIAYTYLDVLGPRLRLREAGRFVWARAGRMWPAYVLVFHVFGIWLAVRTVLGSGRDIAFQAVQPTLSWGEWLQQVFLVQMWDERFLDGASWVGPTWSISAEWLAYLLFPLSALVFFRLRRLPVVVLAAGALLTMTPMAASFVVLGSPYYPFSWLVRILCGFSAGVLTLLAVRRMRTAGDAGERTRRRASVVAGAATTGVVVALLASVVVGADAVGAVPVLFPVLVGSLALADRGPARLLGSRPMVHGGRISYALYLVHIPMFEVLWLAVREDVLDAGSMTAHVVALAVLLATVPVAHLLFTCVEQPARRWMRGLPGRRSVVDVPAQAAGPHAAAPTAAGPEAAGPFRMDSDAARRDPDTSAFPMVVVPAAAERWDSARARLDPPTARLPRRSASPSPARAVTPAVPARRRSDEPAFDGPVPAQQLDTAEWVLARLHAARDAGHGDDRGGDGLAGNLMAAARLRTSPPSGTDPSRPDEVRAVQERVREEPEGAVLVAEPAADVSAAPAADSAAEPAPTSAAAPIGPRPVPVPRHDGTGSRTGVERCGRSRARHSVHASAATPIVATAAAAVRRRRRPSHGMHHRDG